MSRFLVPFILFIPVFFFIPALGQYVELASTDDGHQLYFSSTLRLAGARPDHGEFRIYRVTETGSIELFAERGALAPGTSFASGDGARAPQVSGDGQTVGFSLPGACAPQDPCVTPVTIAALRGRHEGVIGEGSLLMSRNRRWALLTQPAGPPPANITPDATLIDLETGERSSVPPPPPGVRLAVASDGTVVGQRSSGPGLWRQGRFAPLSITGPFTIWGISDDARILIYAALADFPENPRQELVARDLVSGRETVVFSRAGSAASLWPIGISNNGSRLLYRAGERWFDGPAFIANTRTGENAALEPGDGEGTVEGALSGDGRTAFVVTTKGRIVAIDLDAGTSARTLVPATPYVRDLPRFAPGSLTRLRGSFPENFAEGESRMFLDDIPLPMLFAGPEEVGVQAPWELSAPRQYVFRFASSEASPFRQEQLVAVGEMAPRFEPLAPGETSALGFKAVRADFSGFLTSDPKPGEIFVAYATGLGRVRGAVQTGTPAPTDMALPIEGSFRCRFLPYATDAETLFAGLAPGLTGIYQVNFRLPQEPASGPITGGFCSYDSASGSGSFGWWRLGGDQAP
ncbi:MAG: hypothetical protein KIT09_30645 [Bryobacteraceae bacterium]|nr:hypothetical protein [Bryobacteraceae bacterium]